MAFITSLEGQVTNSVTPFVTSDFSAHSLVSTVSVVQGVIYGKLMMHPASDPGADLAPFQRS